MQEEPLELQLLAESLEYLDLSAYVIATADTPVREVIGRMNTLKQTCAFIVGESTQLIGLLTDRDVLHKVVGQPDTWDKPVREIMTTDVRRLSPQDTTATALETMDTHHFRNVPVVQEGGLIRGNVTHHAILRFLADHFAEEIYNLPPVPTNYAKRRSGG